jgi:pilus assembly protein CpaB
MNLKQSIPLIAAVGLGLVAMKIAHDISSKKTTAPEVKTVAVVIAKGPVGPGTALTPEILDVTHIPGETMPAGTAASVDSLVGRVTLAPLFDGQPVRTDYLAPKGAAAGLTSLVPQGMRAIAVDVNETSSVAGLIVPGSHVDIVSTFGTDNEHMVARTVAQDIPIVAVGQRLSPQRAEGDKSDGSFRTVTLLATPHNAELIELAASASRCRLVLRGEGDKARSDSRGVSFVELKGHATDEDQSPVVSASLTGPTTQPIIRADFTIEHPHHTTEVIRGGAVNNVDFQMPVPPSNTMTDTNPNALAVPNNSPN